MSLLREENNILARSSLVTLALTARSGLPTSPKKTVSPVSKKLSLSYESMAKKQELSRVCPGV